MSVATAAVTSTSKPSAIAMLFPGYFALVMATGIVSIAAHFLGMEPIAQGLLWFNVAAYVVLWGLTLTRMAKYRTLFMADLISHGRSVLFLTIVAGTCVLGIMAIVLLLVILQLWLFMATMEAYLGGNDNIVVPGLLASVVCLLLNFGLFHYLRNLDR